MSEPLQSTPGSSSRGAHPHAPSLSTSPRVSSSLDSVSSSRPPSSNTSQVASPEDNDVAFSPSSPTVLSRKTSISSRTTVLNESTYDGTPERLSFVRLLVVHIGYVKLEICLHSREGFEILIVFIKCCISSVPGHDRCCKHFSSHRDACTDYY